MDKHAKRKAQPILTGLIDYFPNACLYVSEVSLKANEQHNPGQPMHWAKEKSIGEGNEIVRHLIDRGTVDDDGIRHTGKVVWRALELLERELLSETSETSETLEDKVDKLFCDRNFEFIDGKFVEVD